MPSLAAKVDALRSFFGLPPEAPLIVAIQMMNEQMGIVGDGPVPKQVDNLVEMTGVEVVLSGADTNFQPAAVAVDVAVDASASSTTPSAPSPAAPSAPSPVAPSAKAPAAPSSTSVASSTAPASKALQKRKAAEAPPQPLPKIAKQMDIRSVTAWTKLFVPKKMLEAAAAASSECAICD